MRTLFVEGDLVCAEIQNVSIEGVISLHTRSLKYGKLENGIFTIVPSHLVKRLPQHYITIAPSSLFSSLNMGQAPINSVDLILGKNGYIWITRGISEEWKDELKLLDGNNYDEATPMAEQLEKLKSRHRNTILLKEEREVLTRIRNSINLLAKYELLITVELICEMFKKTIELNIEIKDMLKEETIKKLSSYFLNK